MNLAYMVSRLLPIAVSVFVNRAMLVLAVIPSATAMVSAMRMARHVHAYRDTGGASVRKESAQELTNLAQDVVNVTQLHRYASAMLGFGVTDVKKSNVRVNPTAMTMVCVIQRRT